MAGENAGDFVWDCPKRGGSGEGGKGSMTTRDEFPHANMRSCMQLRLGNVYVGAIKNSATIFELGITFSAAGDLRGVWR